LVVACSGQQALKLESRKRPRRITRALDMLRTSTESRPRIL
jgi:hypothetical protein